MPQHPLQAAAELRRLDLLAVGGAHRGDCVGADDAAFEQVDLAVVLQALDGVKRPVQAQQGVLVLGKKPLVGQIVDGEHRLGPGQDVLAAPTVVEVDRHQGALPVVAVDHVGVKVQGPAKGQDRSGEKGEALQVVEIISPGGAVELAPFVKLVPLHEIKRGARGGGGHEVEGVADQPEIHLQVLGDEGGGRLPLLHHAIVRHEDLDFDSQFLQGLGQGPDDIGQTSGLGKGHPFRSNKQHAQFLAHGPSLCGSC